jgi:putative CRISPR-associated protein (TIGR02620 family)
VQEHFGAEDMESVDADTTIIGILPPTMVADVNARGGNFVALDVRVPRELFKTELTAEKMEKLGAKLVGYRVTLG